MTQYQLQLLGGFELLYAGKAVTSFRTQKTRILLAYLALNADKVISRKTLAGLFWPESPSERAAHNLRQALSFLRQALNVGTDSSPIIVTRQDISFVSNSRFSVDVWEFDNYFAADQISDLGTAAQLYRGPLLEGMFVDDSPEFEMWLGKTREQYHVKTLSILEQLADFHLDRGEYEQAKTFLMQALELAPWHEAAHRGLMRALALSGDIAGALIQYAKCRQILEDELSVPPLLATKKLYDQIKSGVVAAVPSTPGNPIERAPSPQFVGRSHEHAQLTSALSALVHTTVETVFIEGEVGAGKTRLAEEFNRFAVSQRALVLKGRCFEFGEMVAYQPIVEALRMALKTLGNKLSLSAVWLAELSRLLPEIQDFYPNLPEPQQVNGTAGRQRLFTAVGRFLHALTNDRQPLILFLDDLQWADSTTIDLLHYLIRQNRDNLLLVLGTYRPEETPPTHPITVLRRGLSRDRLVRLIQLKPLTEVDIQQVAERLVGLELAHEFARYLYQESEGNPFVLTEMLNTLHEAELLWPIELDRWGLTANWKNQATQMTSSLRDTILNRVERLPHPEQELLKLAAVIGRTFEADLLQAVSQRSARSSLVIWQERRLVRLVSTADTGHQYDFAHDKIREVVYHQLPTAERQLLHGEVGIGLESRNGAQSPSTPLAPAIAYHYFESDRPNQALPFLLTAAQQAQQALAFTTVIRLCSQALALEPDDLNLRFECLRLRQKSFEYLGEPVREEEDVLAMLAIAEKRQDSQQAMIAQKRLSIFYMHRDPVKAQEIIDRTLPLYQAAGDRANEVETLIIAAILRRNAGETEKAFVLFNQSRQVAFEIGDAKSEGFSLGYIALEQVRQGLLGEAADNYERGATLLRSAHDQSVELGYHLIGTANLYRILGRFTEASETIEQAWQIGVGLEHMGIQCWVHLHRGKIALWQAEHHKAQPHYQKALMVADRHEFGILKGHAYWGLGVANLANGAYQHAVNMLLDALKQFTGSHLEMVTMTHAYLGVAYAKLGDHASALAHIRSITDKLSTSTGANKSIIEGQQIYLCNYQTLMEIGKLSEAGEWMKRGRGLLMLQAAGLDKKWQETFFSIPTNQALTSRK